MSLTTSQSPAERIDAAALRRLMQRRQHNADLPWLHGEVASRMADRLQIIRDQPEQVLDWSEDAGALPPALLAACPKARFRRVDETAAVRSTEGWLGKLTRALKGGEAERLPAGAVMPASAGLLWSNMRLHLAASPPELLKTWRQALQPEGFVMFSTLGPGSLRQIRDIYQARGWGVPHVPFVDMHDLGDMMVEAGFADPVMDQEVLRLTYVTPEALLAEWRALGANLDPARTAGLRTPRWRAQLCAALAETAGPDGRIVLDVEVVYGHAFRAPDKGPAVAADTRIDLADMKLMLRKPTPRK